MSRSFLDASIPELVQKLSTDEKISLLGAPNWWNTTSIPRLEIPSIRMSDGPNVRDLVCSQGTGSLMDYLRVYEDLLISSRLLRNACLYVRVLTS